MNEIKRMHSKWKVNNIESLLEHPKFKEYREIKEELKKEYPQDLFLYSQNPKREVKEWYLNEGGQELYREYIKRLGDIMFEPHGPFSEFLWDSISDQEKEYIDILLKPTENKQSNEYK